MIEQNLQGEKAEFYESHQFVSSSDVSENLSDDRDIAAQLATFEGKEVPDNIDKSLLRKADLFVCSLMCWVYAIQYMDKVANNAASVMGLREDLKMTGKMYSWVGSSFYLSYLIFEVPVSLLLQRFPLAKATAVIICCWGVVMATAGAAQNYEGFMTTRVLLGILEGGITPSFLLITSQWYKRKEQYARTLVWFGFNGLGNIMASSIGYGLFLRGHHVPIAGWRLLYVIFGVITILTGVAFYFHIPDDPSKAWFLTPDEKAWQVERIRENQQGFGTRKIKLYQIKEALRDPRTYLYFIISFMAQLPNGGLTNFMAIILVGMGYSKGDSLLMSLPNGAVMLVGCSLIAVVSTYFLRSYRTVYACVFSLLCCMSSSLLAWGPTTNSQLAGLYLFNWFAPVSFIAMLSLISSNSAGHTKKVFMGAVLLIGYCAGNLVGPQTFKTSEAPGYHTAKILMAVSEVVVFAFQLALLLLNIWENKRRDRKGEKLPSHIKNPEFADLTDFENPEFRYAL